MAGARRRRRASAPSRRTAAAASGVARFTEAVAHLCQRWAPTLQLRSTMAAPSRIRGYLTLAVVAAVLGSAGSLARRPAHPLGALLGQHPGKGALRQLPLYSLRAVL